jgi:hypothetical protein
MENIFVEGGEVGECRGCQILRGRSERVLQSGGEWKKRRKEPCDVCLGVSSYRERPWD